jgi:PPOX class probable F420-dependent enzyme
MTPLEMPAAYLDLLDGPHTAVLATVLPSGTPQASPVWFLRDGNTVLVSTVSERQKHHNVARQPLATLTILDPANQLRYIELRSSVTVEDDPSMSVRDAVVVKHGYTDGSSFDKPGTTRVTLRLTPFRIIEH